MVKILMDADGIQWTETGEYRQSKRDEFYLDPYGTIYTGNYVKVRRGPTAEKVLIVLRHPNTTKTNWEGN